MACEKSTGRGGGPDVVLVDTTWNNIDFLACQLARRGLGVHAFTPRLRRPRYLRLPILTGLTSSSRWGKRAHDAFRAMAERISPRYIIPCSEEALYWLWISPALSSGCVSRMCRRPSGRCCGIGLLLEQAAAWGVPVPAAVPLGSRADCEGPSPQACRSWSSRDSPWGAGASRCAARPGRSSRHSGGSPRWAHR